MTFDPNRAVRATMLLATVLALPGCAAMRGDSCHEPQDYQAAKTAPPLKIPEGLNAPATRGALKIPELPTAAARPRGPGEPCLEEPPSFYPGRPKPGQGGLKGETKPALQAAPTPTPAAPAQAAPGPTAAPPAPGEAAPPPKP